MNSAKALPAMTKHLGVDETLRWLDYFSRMANAAQEVHPSDVLTRASELIADRSTLRTALAELAALHDIKGARTAAGDQVGGRLDDEYRIRKAAAWEAAKAALEATQ